jgi:hypothetical protein
MEQLRASLAGPVTVVRQLDVEPDEALGLFEKMLGEAAAESPDGVTPDRVSGESEDK